MEKLASVSRCIGGEMIKFRPRDVGCWRYGHDKMLVEI